MDPLGDGIEIFSGELRGFGRANIAKNFAGLNAQELADNGPEFEPKTLCQLPYCMAGETAKQNCIPACIPKSRPNRAHYLLL